MEAAALRLIEKMDSEEVTASQLKAGLELAERLMKQRRQRQNDVEDDAGVEALKEFTSPAKAVERLHRDPEFIQALQLKGWLPPAPRKIARAAREDEPLTAERDRRARLLGAKPKVEDDDSGLRAMVQGDLQ